MTLWIVIPHIVHLQLKLGDWKQSNWNCTSIVSHNNNVFVFEVNHTSLQGSNETTIYRLWFQYASANIMNTQCFYIGFDHHCYDKYLQIIQIIFSQYLRALITLHNLYLFIYFPKTSQLCFLYYIDPLL